MILQLLVAQHDIIVTDVFTIDERLDWVKLSSVGKLKQPLQCVKCGLKGTHVVKHRHANEPTETVHHDVYGLFNGKVTMLTVDHIMPRSWGGSNYTSNKQIMCYKCNNHKQDILDQNNLKIVMHNIPMYIKNNHLTVNFIPKLIKQHPTLATIDNFKLIAKQIPRIANFNDSIRDTMIDQMQKHLLS
jgi:5-methylcytosine-specific restriction endonuclease McrA